MSATGKPRAKIYTVQNSRRFFQLAVLTGFLLLFLLARYPYEHGLDADFGIRFSPLTPLFHFLDLGTVRLVLWPALFFLVITPFIGRFFCGWFCPLGTLLDITGKCLHPFKNSYFKWLPSLRPLKFVILVFFSVLALFSIHYWSFLDPLSLFNRFVTVIFYPAGSLLTERILLAVSEIHILEDPAFSVYDRFKSWIMPENAARLQQVIPIFILALLILGSEKITRRFWCRYICPAGAWLGFLSQFRFYERLVGQSCTTCNLCQTGCKMEAIPADEVTKTNKVECIECFNCGAACPPKFKAITYRWRWKPYHSAPDMERRQFTRTVLGSLAAVGLISVGLKSKNAGDRMIRPPGALPEAEFADKCIRCQMCVRICSSNGACLQPDQIHNGLSDLWLPVANMRDGYCEYNCNLCGEVCPTEAIRPLRLEEKQKTSIGLAIFDKNRCIPYARNEDCIVCEEHCPTPVKAIRFDLKAYILADGSSRMVKYPYVDKSLCIGCGICGNKCPVEGRAGIFVTPENQQRNLNSIEFYSLNY